MGALKEGQLLSGAVSASERQSSWPDWRVRRPLLGERV